MQARNAAIQHNLQPAIQEIQETARRHASRTGDRALQLATQAEAMKAVQELQVRKVDY